MPVVTINRQWGAGGETVGRMVAERLHWEYLDGKLIDQVAHRLGLAKDVVENYDERTPGLLDRLLRQLATVDFSTPQDVAAWTPPFSDPAFDLNRSVLRVTQEVIRQAAAKGDCVIVGRGSAYILAGRTDVLRVFLRSNVEARVNAVMGHEKVDEETAHKLVKQHDANAAAYIKQVYGHDWLHPAHYDLVIDTGRVGHMKAVEAILACLPSK
jgi:cytidylate kinase